VSLDELFRMLTAQIESKKAEFGSQKVLLEEDAFEQEEDMGALRLLRLQAALKERRILETKG